MVGNKVLSHVTGVLYNTTLTDMETGYKAFCSDVLKSLDLHEDGFAIEPEITAKICKQRLRIYELPISYYGLEATTRARRSPGAMASKRSGCSSGSA
jgi:hypothetical protein